MYRYMQDQDKSNQHHFNEHMIVVSRRKGITFDSFKSVVTKESSPLFDLQERTDNC